MCSLILFYLNKLVQDANTADFNNVSEMYLRHTLTEQINPETFTNDVVWSGA